MSTTLRARAVAATLAIDMLAFNPGQRRGPDGRWIKMGGGGLPEGDAAPSAVSEEDDELYRELRSEYGWNLHEAATEVWQASRERETDPDPRWLEADPQWEPGDGDAPLRKLLRNLEWDLEDQPELADAAMERVLDHIKAEYPEAVADLPEPPERGALAQLHPRADASDGYGGERAVRADALTKALRSGVAAQKPLSAGFMGDTRMLTLNDGSQAVYKRAISALRPEDLNWEIKDQTDAEHLSSLLAGAIGAPAPVVHRLNDAELAMELVSGRPADASALTDARRRDILATDDAVRIGLLDVLLNNTDRHGGNWMVDNAGGPVAIDHGMAFTADPPAGTSGATKSPFATEHFINPDGTLRATNSLTSAEVARLEREIERTRPQFERAGRTAWLDAALGRLRQLGERAQGPAVTAADMGRFGLRARAAMAGLTVDMLAFNPDQLRGPDGRWIKGGAGAAPATPSKPARKAAAKPKATRKTGANSWLDSIRRGSSTDAAKRQIRQMFEFDDPQTGFRSEVRGVEANGTAERPSYFVTVSIKDPSGLEVGRATRTFWPAKDDPSKVAVHHGSFLLGKRAQGGGFSKRWLAQMEERYKAAGVDRITLFTDDIGGYAWAKAGFDFENATGTKHVATMLGRKIRSKEGQRDLPQRVITDGEELIRRAQSKDPEERPTPMDFAMLGWTPGATSWVGKEAMLGTGWAGVKQL